MLSATEFTYDGIHSGKYGLLIASLNYENVENTPILSPVIKTIKTSKRNRFSYVGIEYENAQPLTFSILSQNDIPDLVRREILSWLVGRNGFKKLQIHQPDYDEYEYRCIFTDAEAIYVNGGCKGFRVTAQFDSPYCYGRPRKKTYTGDGNDYETITVVNTSDILDDYVYPFVIIKPNISSADVDGVYADIEIINTSDDIGRVFEISGLTTSLLSADEELCIDNELCIITKRKEGEITTSPIGNVLDKFNKNWLRLKKGANKLDIKINGRVTIEVPQYVLIGF